MKFIALIAILLYAVWLQLTASQEPPANVTIYSKFVLFKFYN